MCSAGDRLRCRGEDGQNAINGRCPYFSKIWSHSPIGAGNIDFAAVAGKLREIGFKGCCILEVTHDADPARAMEESKARLEAMGWRT